MMKITRLAFVLAALAFGSTGWGQSLYPLFGPVNGVLKGNAATPQTSAAASSDIIGLWSGCSGSNFLRGDGTCAVPAGTGVTSVAQTVPAGFAIAGSPITSTGTLAISYATGQTANRVLATPDGTTGALSLRALVAGDIPPINLGSTANGGVSSATILLGTNGGTSNGFFSVTGPTTALRTFTFPNASATVLTTNALVTVPQGGTGAATLTGLLKGNGTSAFTAAASSDVISLWSGTCSSTTFLRGDGACASAGGGAVGGADTNVQYNNAGVFGGSSLFTWNNTNSQLFINSAATNTNPLAWCANGRTSGERCWSWRIGSSGDVAFDAADDAGVPNGTHSAIDFARVAGAITAMTLGNPTDLPVINAPGGVLVSGGRPTINSANSSISIGATTGGTSQLWITNSTGIADAKMWDIDGNTASLTFRAVNDANSAARNWLNVGRTGAAIGFIDIGNPTDNPVVSLLGGRLNITGATGTGITCPNSSAGTNGAAFCLSNNTTGGHTMWTQVISPVAGANNELGLFIDGGSGSNSTDVMFRVDAGGVQAISILGNGDITTKGQLMNGNLAWTASYVGNGGVALGSVVAVSAYIACADLPGSAVGASSATTFSVGTLPAAARPVHPQTVQLPPTAEDNGVIAGFTFTAIVNTNGTVTFLKNNSSSGWTASNQKGVTTDTTMCYFLN